ncbi:MAG: thioredoxin [Sedimenticola sp.]|nr:MAG: thioredoxin [Sedimenticola sp.]
MTPLTHTRRLSVATLLVILAMLLLFSGQVSAKHLDTKPAPDFPQRAADGWINSSPLTMAGLAGKVLLVDFWTFDCWNCYRSFPWLKGVERQFEETDFQVIGVHSPEFEHERDLDKVRAKVAEFGLEHPIMLDNDFAYWKALGNQYWPSYYLIDKQGRLRYSFIGETHANTGQAQAIETAIKALLAE